MNKEQATQLSSFIPENYLGYNLKIYDDMQTWAIDNENSDCLFHINIIDYIDGYNVELAINMKHCYNKAKDCPIIVRFPETEEEWKQLDEAMCQLRNDSIPIYAHDTGFLLDKRLEK